jgi:hypothetical protein
MSNDQIRWSNEFLDRLQIDHLARDHLGRDPVHPLTLSADRNAWLPKRIEGADHIAYLAELVERECDHTKLDHFVAPDIQAGCLSVNDHADPLSR